MAKISFAVFKKLTRIEHALFGFPFVLAGGLLPYAHSASIKGFGWLWILPGFLLARISGMALNQYIDWKIDAKNPRTQQRVIPSGKVRPFQAAVIGWGALVLFLACALLVNPLVAMLAPIAAFLIAIYSYMKRIHASCHFVLGMIHGLAPIMAAAALTGKFYWSSAFLGAAAFCLIVGNDIIYSLQDEAFDRVQRLHSLPADLGKRASILVAKIFHGGFLFAALVLGIVAKMPAIYFGILFSGIAFFFSFYRKLHHTRVSLDTLLFVGNVSQAFSLLLFIILGIVWHA